jgi:HD-GYP domain-containing protein (c-di-GMP phosphodiesterase class II)
MSSVLSHLNLLASIVTALLLVLTYCRRRVRSYLSPFLIMAAAFVLWQAADYTAFSMHTLSESAFTWKKIAFLGAAFIPAALFHISLPLAGRVRLLIIPLYALSSLAGYMAFHGGMFRSFTMNSWGLVLLAGWAYPLWCACSAGLFGFSVWNLVRAIKYSTHFTEVERSKYLLLGTLLCGLAVIDLVSLYGVPLPALGFIFVFIAIFSISYVIVEEDPLEFSIFMNRISAYGGIYLLMLFLLSLVVYLSSSPADRMKFEETIMSLFAMSLFFIFVLMLFLPLKEKMVIYLDRVSLGPRSSLEAQARSLVQELSAMYDIDKFLSRLVDFFSRVLGFDSVSVLLLDENRNAYKVMEGRNHGNNGVVFPRNEEFVTWSACQNRLLMRDELDLLPRAVAEMAEKAFELLNASYCLPMVRSSGSRTQLIGMIALGGRGRLDFRMKTNRDLLEFLRSNSSYFLYQGLMSRKRRDELVLLSRYRERVLMAEAVEDVLKHLVGTIHDFMKVERISILLLDEQNKSSLVIKESFGIPEDIVTTAKIDVNDDKKVSGWVFKNRRALLADNVEQDFDAQKKECSQYTTRSCISAPILLKGEPIGVINVNNKMSGEPFDSVDLEVLKGMANEASISLIWAQMRQTDQSRVENLVRTLAKTLEAKDPFTQGHADRVAEYAGYIASEMNLSEEKYATLLSAGSLHDIGKISIPDSVLLKPGKLTDEEFALIKSHSNAGEEILRQAQISNEIVASVKYHHERYDGRGYPEGLKGDDIPLLARILAVADAFDAMMSNRAYRKKMKFSVVKEQIVKNKGTQFDPLCADIFLKWLDENAPPDDEDIDQIELSGQMEQRKFGDPPAAPAAASTSAPASAPPATSPPASGPVAASASPAAAASAPTP